VIVLIGLMVLTGCRAAGLPASAASDEVSRLDPSGQEVILWHSLVGAAAEELAVLVDEFNAVNPWHIIVVPQYQGVYPMLRNRLDESFDRKTAPDLAVLYPYHAAYYVGRGTAVALDAYLTSTRFGLSEADRADIFTVFLNSDRSPHLSYQLVSFPMERSAMILYYNADWLKSLGYPDPPLTWSAFKEMCQRATTDLNSDGNPDTYGYALVPDASIFAALLFSQGERLLGEDARQVGFNTETGAQALSVLHEMFGSHQAYVAQGQGWDRLDWAKRQVLFTIAPSSELPTYKTAVEEGGLFRWSVAPLPHSTPEPVTNLFGQSWTILKTTPQRQLAAWLFVRWFSSTDQTRRWAQATSTLPLRRSAAKAIGEQPELDPNIAIILGLLPFGQSEPTIAGWDVARQVLDETVRAIAAGQAPSDALAQAEVKINPLLMK